MERTAAVNTTHDSGVSSPKDDSAAVSALEGVWKLFVQGSQEQLTRLRVAGVFYRTMEQVIGLQDHGAGDWSTAPSSR